jgi:parvulin-like peptidyl-prolyl isomerase
MPSREIRRIRAKKGEAVSDIIERRHEIHPVLYIFSIVVLVVVVVTFVALPTSGKLGGSGGAGSHVFGSYNGWDVTYQQGTSYFAQRQSYWADQFRQYSQGQQESLSLIKQIWYQAYQDTILHVSVLQVADQAGLMVSDTLLDRELLSYPDYQENGVFSADAFKKTTKAEQLQVRKYMREQVVQSKLFIDYFGGIKTGDQENSFILAMANKERSFQFASFLYSDYPANEVKSYAQANTAEFRKIKVSRIFVSTNESDATAIRKKIQDNTGTFEDLAKNYSQDSYATNNGDMGWRYSYDLESDFENKDLVNQIFALKAGEVSEVLKGSYGWLIYRCDSPVVDADLTDTATLDEVKTYILKYEKGKVEDYFNELAGKLSRRSGEIGFESAAVEAGVKIYTTNYFPINLQGIFTLTPLQAVPDTATPSSAVYSEEFFTRAFSLGKDTVSSPILLDDRIVVLKLIGERQLPAETATAMANVPETLANQALQTDLETALVDSTKLRDNFDAAFTELYGQPTASQ